MNGDLHQRLKEEKRAMREVAAKAKAAKAGRDPGQFVAWLKTVQQSPGWQRASHTARSLLMDMVHSGPNGKLSASMKYLSGCGWTSASTITKSVKELIACGLLVETRKGARPNRPAWYAVTWLHLQHTEGLDINPRAFKTGGYMTPDKPADSPRRDRTAAATKARRMQAMSATHIMSGGYTLRPSDGQLTTPAVTVQRSIADANRPSDGAIGSAEALSIRPSDGAYLDIAICPRSASGAAAASGARGRMGALLGRALVPAECRPDAYSEARAAISPRFPEAAVT